MSRPQWISPRVTKIPSPLPGIDIQFGWPVLVHGSEIYATAQEDDTGAVFIYSRVGSAWSSHIRLTASDGKTADRFGGPSIDGDLMFIGSGNGGGSTYVFGRNGSTWKEIDKLTQVNGGFSPPAFDKDTLAIGSSGYYDTKVPSLKHGAVYVLYRSGTTWIEKDTLTPSRKGNNWRFGNNVDIDDNTIVVGVHKEPLVGMSTGWAGAAYAFGRQGTVWKQEARLAPNDLKPDDGFGWDLALDGNTLVVGAFAQDSMGSNSGAVYVFNRSGTKWTQVQKILPGDLKKDSMLGHGVAIDGDYMALGALGDSDQGYFAGAVYIYQRSGSKWIQKHKVYAPDGKADTALGTSVSLDYPIVAASAVGKTEAVYVIELNVLVKHDGGPPGSSLDKGLPDQDLSIDLVPPPDKTSPSDSAHDLRDPSDLSWGDGAPGAEPGCSCTVNASPTGSALLPLAWLLLLHLMALGRRRR